MVLSKRIKCLSFLHALWITSAAAFNVTTISFDQGFTPLFGDGSIIRSSDGNNVKLLLDRFTGSGFISSDLFSHGFFSANIKLPISDYTAGIVIAFYMSNGDVFKKTHDEVDFEFLGNTRGKEWRFQTNMYGNGSTVRGREERYTLWFDPSLEFHRYSVLWTSNNIIFYVDDIPIREIVNNDAMGGDFPSKPMSLYATIWDASTWATSGGKYKVNYKYSPFISQFSDFVLDGCVVDPIEQFPTRSCDELDISKYTVITPKQRIAMQKFRQKYMYYSHCYDHIRYPIPPSECVIVAAENERFGDNGRLRPRTSQRRRVKRSNINTVLDN